MAGVQLTFSADDLQRTLEQGTEVPQWTKRQAEQVADRARQLAPSRSGRLRSAIDVAQNRDTAGRFSPGWQVVCDVPYALFVHEGTRPHPIRPVRASALAFYWEKVGAFVFFPPWGRPPGQVNHPGTTGQPFLRDALDVLR